MAIVLPNSFSRRHFPQACGMIRRGSGWSESTPSHITWSSHSPVTRYAESALKAQSQTQRWWPLRVFSWLKSYMGLMDHILTVVSAEHVARYLSMTALMMHRSERKRAVYRASGLSKHRVRYFLWAKNRVTAWNRGRFVLSSFSFQT